MHHLLFLPGAGGSAGFWEPLGALLPASWDKHYLSWPGLGNQPHDPVISNFEDLVTLTEGNLASAPVDLVAQSMGGAVALAVAIRNPRRIRRLVLAATSGGIDVSDLPSEDWRPAYRSEFPNAARWITEAHPNYASALSSVQQRTLLLWGDADRISPVSVGRRLQSLLPNATLSVVAKGDHSFASSQANEIADEVIRHLQ